MDKNSLLETAAWVNAARNMARIWDRQNTPRSLAAAEIADRFLRVAQMPPMTDPMAGGFGGAPAMGITPPQMGAGMPPMGGMPTMGGMPAMGSNPMQAQTQQLWQAIQRVDQFYAAQLMELQKQIKGMMDNGSGAVEGQPAAPTQPAQPGPADAATHTGDAESSL